MQTPIADNFDLHINTASDGNYALTVISPQGETQEPVLVPIDYEREELHQWLNKVYESTITDAELRILGQQLSDYLLPQGVIRELFKSSLDQARRAGKRLRIRLRITPPEIAALPWELAYDEIIGDFFVLYPATWLIRYPNLPIAPGNVASLTPVPLLSIIAQPIDFPQQLNLLEEVKGLIEACQGLLDQGAITMNLLFGGRADERAALVTLTANRANIHLFAQTATLSNLSDILRTQPYRILHFLGHGFFTEDQGGQLIMTDAQGLADFVTDEIFARELQDRGLALAVLNACQSATQAPQRAFMGVASRLIQVGLPAVIAMQADILDSSAIRFAQTLYKALADGWPIDAAVTEGRRAIRASQLPGRYDWGTPVLFMRAVDGQIFAHGVANEELVSPIRSLQTQVDVAAEQARLAHQQASVALASGIKGYLKQLQTIIHVATADKQGTPYRGLLEYRLSDSALFFGRQQAIQQLLQVLERGSLTVLQGRSGSGKTSLLQAGIAPQLVAQGSLVVMIRAYDQSPTLALKQTLLAEIKQYSAVLEMSLVQFVQHVVTLLGDAHPFYIIFDQFEEFFTQVDITEQTAFIDELAACLHHPTLGARFLLALRTEFYGQLANFSQLGASYANQYTLKELSTAEAAESITRPLAAYGIALENGLAEQIVRDISQQKDVLPPQLQIICLTLYEELALPEQTVILQAMYHNLGSARGILQEHLQKVLQHGLQPGEFAPANLLLEEFVTSSGQRILRAQDDLQTTLQRAQVDGAITLQVLGKLVRNRLLRVWESHAGVPGTFYELAHDYLVAKIRLEPAVRQRKEAEELLARAQINWEKYSALLDEQTFPVIHEQRNILRIPEGAFALIARSALVTDLDPAWWLRRAPAATARLALIEALNKNDPTVCLRAVALAQEFADNRDVQQALVQRVYTDPDPRVRRLAFDTLVQVDRKFRFRLLPGYFYVGLREMLEKYQRRAFIIVAPILLVILGWNLWISWSWQRVAGLPTDQPIASLLLLDDQIFLGGRDSGFQHRRNNQWLDNWLTPPVAPNAQGLYPAISAMAVDRAYPDRIYLYVAQQGLFLLNEPEQRWTQVGQAHLPLVNRPAVAAHDNLVLFATQSDGLYVSMDGGKAWEPAADKALGPVLYVALFDQAGVAYVGGRNGLFRADPPPTAKWEEKWEKLVHVPVQNVVLGADDYFYIAGEQAAEVTCYRDQSSFQSIGTPFSFFWNLPGRKVAMLAAHPTQPGIYYVADTYAGIYEFTCDRSRRRLMGRVWGVEHGVNGMGVQQLATGQDWLVQANSQGLYRRFLSDVGR